MSKIKFLFILVAGSAILSGRSSTAGPLSSAEITKIINRVSVIDPAKGGHSATVREVIKNDLGVLTGARSRSELLFQDNTLTRIGAETFFSFKTGTRDMTLEKGSMLLQVPKGLGGAKIHTAAVTAAITGTTIMMEYMPRSYIKVLVLEGSLRLSRNGTLGDSLLLSPGKMVIMRPDAKRIPDPVDVDLERIVKTSTLVNFAGGSPLPSMPLIRAAINEQKTQITKKKLVRTNLVIHGNQVIFASGDQLARNVRPIGSGGTVNRVTNGVLGGSPAAAVSVSNSTQVLGLLNNVASTSAGTVTISPPTVNVGGTVPAVVAQPNVLPGAAPILNGLTPNIPAVSTPTAPASGAPVSLGGH